MPEKVLERIYSLLVPLPQNPLKSLNSYLIIGRDGGRNLLIDTGFRRSECREALLAGLDALNVSLRDTDIFLTHLHSDHAGLASELASDGAKIYISRADVSDLPQTGADGGVDYDAREQQRWLELGRLYQDEGLSVDVFKGILAKNQAALYSPRLPWDYTIVEDGDMLHYGGYDLQCVATPGHTLGHMCLFCAAEKLMFLGDHILFDITPNISVWSNFTNSLAEYMRNLEKIRQYKVEIPLPAHRTVNHCVDERIDQLIAHHKKRADEVLAIIGARPGLSAYEIAALMTWQIRCASWEDFPVGQKWFAFGEALAHLYYLRQNGQIQCRVENGVQRNFRSML